MTQTSYSEENIHSFYNDVDDTLEKPNHHAIVMEGLNTLIGKGTNSMETAASKFELELRYERGDTLVEWATSGKYKIMNTMFQKKAGRIKWKSPKV